MRVEIADGPKHWTKAAVVRQPQKWDMLCCNRLLKELDVEPVTPAMRKHQQGKTAAMPTFAVDADTLPAPDTLKPKHQMMRRDPAADYVVDDSPIELLPDVGAAARAESADMRLIQPQKMRIKLGLPADYFVKDRDADFHKWNDLYPAVTREEVAGRIVHQLSSPADVALLLDSLMSGANALRDYPSGYLPPAAIKPIKPPMRPDAKLIFTVQHKVSEAAYQVREEFIKIRLERGIDKPTQAHSQMPVFTRPKPNTTARRVLFDDSANNCLNVIHTGIELSTWYEVIAFLDDVVILTPVDLDSFFRTMRLHGDIWAY
ncbi:hypothetical protein H4S07_002241 [Coemansia furcata]|uniref:Uncharacterized protein n=1 Tax=Coemansia furcata TaxID=417177 RepID=A0ACC1LKR1_9FUNG|nr:hypothetical protein H4S07_002241 [Coemansia furcata]